MVITTSIKPLIVFADVVFIDVDRLAEILLQCVSKRLSLYQNQALKSIGNHTFTLEISNYMKSVYYRSVLGS